MRPQLSALRKAMSDKNVDWVLIRSTDQYLNEYVPVDESARAFFTGFTGSAGDALVGLEDAVLFVDGRYTLQAHSEAQDFDVLVATGKNGITGSWLDFLESSESLHAKTLAVETEKIPHALYEKIVKSSNKQALVLDNSGESLLSTVKSAMETKVPKGTGKLMQIPLAIAGQSTLEKLNASTSEAFLCIPLDEIAWLSNIRGLFFPYQATFPAVAVALKAELLIFTGEYENAVFESAEGVQAFPISALAATLRQRGVTNLNFDPKQTPKKWTEAIEQVGIKITACPSPFSSARAKKNPAELQHMRESFKRADDVVFKTQTWACKQIEAGSHISEYDLDQYIRKAYKDSGTIELSFNPICGHHKNGAIVHYGTPNPKEILQEGNLFLLDSGGLYEGGYATDLTRTFLLGGKDTKGTPEQIYFFTLVLKAALSGLMASFPKGTTGAQLDAIVRAPLWQESLNFAHGTGHGVGINVHEAPPSISHLSTVPLEIGHVFSIEPGYYDVGFGGIRIENLATVVEDPRNSDFLRVLPLTFAPLDMRLVDKEKLTQKELLFLNYFEKGFEFKGHALPPLAAFD